MRLVMHQPDGVRFVCYDKARGSATLVGDHKTGEYSLVELTGHDNEAKHKILKEIRDWANEDNGRQVSWGATQGGGRPGGSIV